MIHIDDLKTSLVVKTGQIRWEKDYQQKLSTLDPSFILLHDLDCTIINATW